MKLLYEEPDNKYKIYGDVFNSPYIYCIYCEHDDYIAKDRQDGLIYVNGFKTKQEAWDYYKRNYRL